MSEGTALVTHPDGSLWFDRGTGTDDYLGPADHETGLIRQVLERVDEIPHGNTFLDVGAHVGGWAVRFARAGWRVIAVEPNPNTVWALKRNVDVNGVSDCVQIAQECLWDLPSLAYTFRDAKGYASGGSSGLVQQFGTPVLSGKTETGDRLWDRLKAPHIGLVKIDVEGAEVEVLRGMVRMIDCHGPDLLIEVHDHISTSVRERVIKFLTEFHYEWTEHNDYGLHFYARRANKEG